MTFSMKALLAPIAAVALFGSAACDGQQEPVAMPQAEPLPDPNTPPPLEALPAAPPELVAPPVNPDDTTPSPPGSPPPILPDTPPG
jgi:hypothetical protein